MPEQAQQLEIIALNTIKEPDFMVSFDVPYKPII